MKIYRRMNIGTGKPSPEVRAEIPHHCIDIAEPSEGLSVAQYVAAADEAIEAVRSAGAVPLAVGGTSLYIKALSEGLFDGPPADPELRGALRKRAQDEGLASLHAELARVDPTAAERIHPNDAKRIIRALEVHRATGQPISALQSQWGAGRRRHDCIFIGLTRDKAQLNHRINLRAKRMIEVGLRDEVAALLAEPAGLSDQAAQAVGYAEMIAHLRGQISLAGALEQIKVNTRRLARKQPTWHRRFADVQWFSVGPDEPATQTVERILQEVRFE